MSEQTSAVERKAAGASDRLTGTDVWEGRGAHEAKSSILFDELFHRYLADGRGKSCFEVGCVPGSFLAYIASNFGYCPEGIDFVPETEAVVGETLRNYGIEDYQVYRDDFLNWEPPRRYDLVLSFGFIEHFQGKSLTRVVSRTVDLLKPGGLLFLEVPNFNYGQFVLHYLLDKRNLDLHNVATMRLSFFREIARGHDLEPLLLGYYGGPFQFWAEKKDMRPWQKPVYSLLRRIGKIGVKLFGNRLNNRLFSPYLVMIARKR